MLLKQRLFAAETFFRPPKGPLAIAFLDTGVSPVADFTLPDNRIVAFLDLVNGKTEPYDDNGHGTHVTGSFLVFIDERPVFRKTKNPLPENRKGIRSSI